MVKMSLNRAKEAFSLKANRGYMNRITYKVNINDQILYKYNSIRNNFDLLHNCYDDFSI